MEFILTSLLNNTDVITLIMFLNEVTSLLFNSNRNSGYVDERIDYKTDMKYTLKFVLLSISIEK
jgi:hypothetical protein